MNKNIYAIILIILAVGLYFTVTTNILAEAKIVKLSNDEYKTAIDNAKRLIDVRDKVILDYNKLSVENRAKLDKIIPKNVDNIRLIIEMNDIAYRKGLPLKNVNVSISSASPEDATQDQSIDPGANSEVASPVLDKAKINFDVDATYQQFISFLQTIESNLRIMDVDSLSVTTSEDGVYNWKVSLTTYWSRVP
jgi:hypothetical protein